MYYGVSGLSGPCTSWPCTVTTYHPPFNGLGAINLTGVRNSLAVLRARGMELRSAMQDWAEQVAAEICNTSRIGEFPAQVGMLKHVLRGDRWEALAEIWNAYWDAWSNVREYVVSFRDDMPATARKVATYMNYVRQEFETKWGNINSTRENFLGYSDTAPHSAACGMVRNLPYTIQSITGSYGAAENKYQAALSAINEAISSPPGRTADPPPPSPPGRTADPPPTPSMAECPKTGNLKCRIKIFPSGFQGSHCEKVQAKIDWTQSEYERCMNRIDQREMAKQQRLDEAERNGLRLPPGCRAGIRNAAYQARQDLQAHYDERMALLQSKVQEVCAGPEVTIQTPSGPQQAIQTPGGGAVPVEPDTEPVPPPEPDGDPEPDDDDGSSLFLVGGILAALAIGGGVLYYYSTRG